MDEHDGVRVSHRGVNELASAWQVDEEVFRTLVLDGNTMNNVARRGMVGRNGLGADGYDVRNPSLVERLWS